MGISGKDFGAQTRATDVAAAFAGEIKGKIVLITGISPNSIGSALAHALAPHSPALLLLASRTPSNIRAVTQSIHASHAAVPVREVALDLSSQASVRTAAAAIRAIIVAGLGEGDGKGNARGERGIDVIFNNAGINISERRLSVDGVELQFATNHLGPFLLTNLLLPLLLQPYSSPAKTDRKRIVNTSSESHRISPIRFSDINQVPGAQVAEADKPRRGLPKGLLRDDGRYEPAVAYGVSKTANVLMAVELNRALGGRGVKSLAVMPGIIKTELIRGLDEDALKGLMQGTPDSAWKTLDQGAATLVVAGFDPALDDEEGVYLEDCQMRRPSKWATDPVAARRLWVLSEEMVGEKFDIGIGSSSPSESGIAVKTQEAHVSKESGKSNGKGSRL